MYTFRLPSLRVAGEGGVAKMNAEEGEKERKGKRGQPLFLRFVRGAPFAGSHYRSMDGCERGNGLRPPPLWTPPLHFFFAFYASSMTPPISSPLSLSPRSFPSSGGFWRRDRIRVKKGKRLSPIAASSSLSAFSSRDALQFIEDVFERRIELHAVARACDAQKGKLISRNESNY